MFKEQHGASGIENEFERDVRRTANLKTKWAIVNASFCMERIDEEI